MLLELVNNLDDAYEDVFQCVLLIEALIQSMLADNNYSL